MNDFTTNSTSSIESESNRFSSLASLRTFHANLLKLHRESENESDVLTQIEQFIRKGKATGAILVGEEDRWSVQSLLDYWSSLLYRAGIKLPDVTLDKADSSLISEPRNISPDTQVTQSVSGSQNQVIGQVLGGTVIANVKNLIQHFHLSPQEILLLGSFWQNWSQDTNPPLSPSLMIGGREQERDRIISWLRGSPSPLSLQADSPEEAISFLAAVIHELDDEEKSSVLSRAVVVNSAVAWQNLISSSDTPLILIPQLQEVEGIGQAIKNGHHVFIPLGRTSSDKEHRLPRIKRDSAEEALRAMGLSRDRAKHLATLARRSLSALRRKLAIARNIQQPAWARANNARSLLAPLLASAWDDSCVGDREALAQLSGMPYERLQAILVRWANETDPPVRRVGDVWMIAAQEDAWRLLAGYLTNDDLQCFENVAIDILSELDSAFELPPEQRYAASVYGKVLNRSGRLRESIAETLALMATLSSEVSFIANKTGEDVTRRVIRQLMERARNNPDLWASLAYQLPLLAEAAPGIFLDAVDAGLSGENPILVSLFQDRTSDAFVSSSPHTGLLWALETLAWHPDYLSQAALSLARLTRLDPGGRLANRPAASLRDIFICWHPNTTASLNSRLNVLDAIRRREPEVAWHLLINLLPKHHSVVSPTHGTKWRDWVPDPLAGITVQEYLEATNAILQRLLSNAGNDATRWCSLIAAMASMSDEQQESLLQCLETLDPEQFSSKERNQICDYLRHEATRHRDFPDAQWAMPAGLVKRLEGVFTRLEPDDPVDRYQWLFKHNVELPGIRRKPWSEREEIAENLRAEALEEILKVQGWSGVLRLAEQVVEPALVGHTLAKGELLPIDVGSFLEDNLGSSEAWRSQMAQRFIRVSATNQGEVWIEACINAGLEGWTSEQYGEFLLCLPFNESLLDRLDTATEEVQRYFWTRTQNANLPDAAQAGRVLTQLIKVQRVHYAVNVIRWAIERTPTIVSPERIAEVLELSVQTPPEPSFDFSNFAYCSSELLDHLEKTELSRDRLAQLEWLYLRIHEHHRRPHILYGELSKNPTVFIDVLQCIFPSENEPSVKETSADTKAFALLALDFLESWKQMPGVQEDSSVDAEALRAWVVRARELAAECGRTEVADIYIGHVLAFSPIDPDGIWPHRAVRNLIEELENPVIERGWRTQIFNNRGITTRMPTDGGEQERTLAERYQNDARQIGDRWQRTAAVFRDLVEIYHRDAIDQDHQAEITQDFWR